MSISSTSTMPTVFIERKESSILEIGESSARIEKKAMKNKSKGKEKIKTSIVTKEKEFIVSYQDGPVFLQFIFDQTVIPLIEDFQKIGDNKAENDKDVLLSPRGDLLIELEETSTKEKERIKKKKTKNSLEQANDIEILKKITAQSRCFELLKGIVQQSILLRMDIFQLATLRVNAMNVSLDGIPLLTPDVNSYAPTLAIRAVSLCVGQLIGRKKATNVWTFLDGKQFLTQLTELAEQYFNFRCIIPSDHLLNAVDTETYQDPNLKQFIQSTTENGHKTIKKIAYKNRDNIDDHVLDKIVKAADTYFYVELPKAAAMFYEEIDRKLKFIKPLGQAYQFRRNTVASVRFMKQAEHKKHLRLTNPKELPEDHIIEKKDLIVNGVKHKQTLVKVTKTNLVKVITLAKEGTEEADVYLFVQFVQNPDTPPDPKKETQLLKFDITPGTNQIWVKEPEANVKQALLNEFAARKYVPSIYTAIQFKNEIILVEMFKKAGFSMSTRLLAGSGENYLQSLKPKYDKEFKELLGGLFESGQVAVINNYLSDSHHNKDLDIVSKKSRAHLEEEKELGKDEEEKVIGKPASLLARKSIAHHKEEAVKRKIDYLAPVRDSILGAMYDDPLDPMDLGEFKLPEIAEKINIEYWKTLFKKAVKEKDQVLLGLTETIYDSISKAFEIHKKPENALKMLDISFEKKEFKTFLELESKKEMFLAIFKNFLGQCDAELAIEHKATQEKLKLTQEKLKLTTEKPGLTAEKPGFTTEQRELCFKFFDGLSANRMA